MAKPRGDMGTLGIPKSQASAAVPFASPAQPAVPSTEAGPAGKSLTVKLDGADYWALRDYCIAREKATGTRVTHQQVMVEGLRALLRAEGKS